MGSIDEKVMNMLGMPVTLEPDKVVGTKHLIKRLVTLDTYSVERFQYGVCIDINVKPQVETEPESHNRIYKVYYRGGLDAISKGDEFKKFLEPDKGQKAFIIYILKSGVPPILQMIAPLEEYQLYVRGLEGKEGLVLYKLDFKVRDYPQQNMAHSLNK